MAAKRHILITYTATTKWHWIQSKWTELWIHTKENWTVDKLVKSDIPNVEDCEYLLYTMLEFLHMALNAPRQSRTPKNIQKSLIRAKVTLQTSTINTDTKIVVHLPYLHTDIMRVSSMEHCWTSTLDNLPPAASCIHVTVHGCVTILIHGCLMYIIYSTA